MIIFKRAADVRSYLQNLMAGNHRIGFIPTMGALHTGHISLVEKSKEIAGVSVCSIFVNPTQFNNPQDFNKYPVTIEQDIYLLEKNGCDVLFLPSVEEIYPGGNFPDEHFNLGYLESVLEGRYRPGHFQGVCQVVKRLLEIVAPAYLLAGQKDYQQCLVLKRLLQIIDSPAELVICPTVREKDGLAMSSRNLRLQENERMIAPAIFQAINLAARKIKPGAVNGLKSEAAAFLTGKGLKVDYVEVANAGNLQLVDQWNGQDPLIVLAAAHVNDIRLIDNVSNTVSTAMIY